MYSRPGCHLCDDARAVLDRIGEPFTEIDITTDDALHAAYLERIPVVVLDGVELFDYFVHEPALRGLLSLHPPDRPAPAQPRSAVDTS
jgi:glutaredoxin